MSLEPHDARASLNETEDTRSSNVSKDGAALIVIPDVDMHPTLELKHAFRDGELIGNGLFVPPNSKIGAGEEVAAFVQGAYMRARQ